HLALHRDVNLLLVDASAPEDLHALLPAGRLREPLSAAARATLVCLTLVDQARMDLAVAEIVKGLGLTAPPIRLRFTPDTLVDVAGGAEQALARVKGQAVFLFSGIGNGGSFSATMAGLGAIVAGELRFPDHHTYRSGDLERIREQAKRCGAQFLVTTEKDAGKVAPLLTPGDRVLALRLEMEILEGRERVEQLVFEGVGVA
ncbi:MAG: tetraacyldisaccharide 4'-kinase, partial [Nitrospiraceae bacterium]